MIWKFFVFHVGRVDQAEHFQVGESSHELLVEQERLIILIDIGFMWLRLLFKHVEVQLGGFVAERHGAGGILAAQLVAESHLVVERDVVELLTVVALFDECVILALLSHRLVRH